MNLPTQKIQLIAADPIDAGDIRLLPSVLVSTTEGATRCGHKFSWVTMRPRSVVVTSEQGTEWLEIPDTTADALSVMAVAAGAIAAVSLLLIAIIRYLKRP